MSEDKIRALVHAGMAAAGPDRLPTDPAVIEGVVKTLTDYFAPPEFPEARPGEATPHDSLTQFFGEPRPASPQMPGLRQTFRVMSEYLLRVLPHNQERDVAMRRLLEAKEAAMRACLFKS